MPANSVVPAVFATTVCFFVTLQVCMARPGEAQAAPDRRENQELIVLLRAGDPRPEFVVREIQENRPAPAGLGEGNPNHARLAITSRAKGERKSWLETHPDTPEARLQRYVVLGYPENVNLDAIATALGNNPRVEHVEKNLYLTLSAAPAPKATKAKKTTTTDPLLEPPSESAGPDEYQWGQHVLRLPEAWELTRGHTQIGVVDRGTQVSHPDLRAIHRAEDGSLVFDGGSFREHRSQDLFFGDCDVDEQDPDDDVTRETVGHGVHVAGILAATTFNGIGVAGTCPGCSLQLMKTFDVAAPEVIPDPEERLQTLMDTAASSITALAKQGVTTINLSFGIPQEPCTEQDADLRLFCQTINLATGRDALLAGASGNNRTEIQFPANAPEVVAVGGLAFRDASPGYELWDDCPSGVLEDCSCPYYPRIDDSFLECGSNKGPEQELVAPAKEIFSTVYEGFDHNTDVGCGDSFPDPDSDEFPGYGHCTGTSMATPFVTGIAALVRSANPLLRRSEVRDILVSTASSASARSEELGFGVPDARAAVARALGTWNGPVASTRLTPVFGLYSSVDTTHAFVTSPTMALGLLLEDEPTDFVTVGPSVSGYPHFPGLECVTSPCDPTLVPGASFFVFTTENHPLESETPPLVPLHRVLYDVNLPNRCLEEPPARVAARDFSYTTTEEGIVYFHETVVDGDGVGYQYEGVEGYLYQRCSPEPECIPPGAEKIYRYYHANRDDYAIFPESELAQWEVQGYGPTAGQLADVIGYAYPNVDTDGDDLIDGYELIMGTDPSKVDSDCDGVGDGEEALIYQSSGPPEEHGFRDPLIGPCGPPIFEDGFETGDTSRWAFSS